MYNQSDPYLVMLRMNGTCGQFKTFVLNFVSFSSCRRKLISNKTLPIRYMNTMTIIEFYTFRQQLLENNGFGGFNSN